MSKYGHILSGFLRHLQLNKTWVSSEKPTTESAMVLEDIFMIRKSGHEPTVQYAQVGSRKDYTEDALLPLHDRQNPEPTLFKNSDDTTRFTSGSQFRWKSSGTTNGV